MSIEAVVAKAPSRARGVQRVAQLLDAAAHLFTEKGYEGTTMTEIAQRAGASIGSLYQFFPTKEVLAEAIFSRYMDRVTARMQELEKRATRLSATQLADRLVDLILEVRSDRTAAASLSDAIASIIERRKPLRGAARRHIVAILRAANPKLSEKAAAAAAVVIAHVLKVVPILAQEEEEGGQGMIAQARKMLAIYLGSLRSAKKRTRA